MVKKALLIGLNYKDTVYELKGCINDINAMKDYMIANFMYLDSNIMCLYDNQDDKLATKQNIIEKMKWLSKDIKKGDSLVLYVSSHGEQITDANNDEIDGQDEAIVCMNDEKLTDDEIWSNLISKIPEGVLLSCFFDCCHSGTIADLKYSFQYSPNVSDKNLAYNMSIDKSVEAKGNVICYSGCYDPDTSADGSFDGKIITLPNGKKEFVWGAHRGAFSYYLLQTLQECNNKIEYPDLLKAVYTKLASNGYTQKPQFSCSKSQLFTGKFGL